MGLVAGLALAQLRRHRSRWALLATGAALAIAIGVVAAGSAAIMRAQAVRSAVNALPPAQRAITVVDATTVLGTGADSQLDQQIEAQLARLTGHPVRREILYRQLVVDGTAFFTGGVDDIGSAVRLTSGRLPRSCSPSHCEVVALGDAAPPSAAAVTALTHAAASLGVVVVGAGIRADPLVAAGTFSTAGTPLLLGDGVRAVAQLQALELFGRTFGWVAPLDLGRVTRLGVPAYLARAGQVQAALNGLDGISTTGPQDVLLAADSRAEVSARRFGLIGGSGAVLLLGFSIVAAVGIRSEHRALAATLRRRGGSRRQIAGLTVIEAGVAGAAGALAGVFAASGLIAWLAARSQLAGWQTVRAALRDDAAPALGLTLAAIAVTVVVLLCSDSTGIKRWLDAAALASAAAAVLAAGRGSTSAGTLTAGADPLVIALPVLVAVTAALIAARVWLPVASLLERRLPAAALAARIALLGAVRRPLRSASTAGFLTAAICAVVFAGAYRATLLDAGRDEAAYQVPLTATLQGGPELVDPLAVHGALPAGTRTYPVIRSSGVVQTPTAQAVELPLVGVDPAALSAAARWSRTSGSAHSGGWLAAALTRPDHQAPARPQLAGASRQISLQVGGNLPALQITVWVAADNGREFGVVLHAETAPGTSTTGTTGASANGASTTGAGTNGASKTNRMTGIVPTATGSQGFSVVGIELDEDPEYATLHGHSIGEGNSDEPIVAGTVTFSSVRVDSRPADWAWPSWSSRTAQLSSSSDSLAISYRLLGSPVSAVAAGADTDLAVAVDPQTAAAAVHGKLSVRIDGISVAAQVVARLPRLPTVTGSFILTDQQSLSTLLDSIEPGTGAPHELWLQGPAVALSSALAQPPFDELAISERQTIQAGLQNDPIARGSRLLLGGIALLAALIAAASIVILVIAERSDGAAELLAWESDGAGPAVLRRMLLLRGAVVALVATPLGVLAGTVLAVVGTRLITVDAVGASGQPPLQVSAGALGTVLALVLILGGSLLITTAVVAGMLREPLPTGATVQLR